MPPAASRASQWNCCPSPAGDSGSQAKALAGARADVVIGPTDSSHAAAAIDVLSAARIPLISPANSAAGLSTYKSGGYYFRTAAADVAQASVLVKLAKDGGAYLVGDSPSGQRLREGRLRRSGRLSRGCRPADRQYVGLHARRRAAGAAVAARDKAPDAVVLIARDGAQGAIAELNNAGLSGSRIILSDGAFGQYGSGLGSKALEGARAVVPGTLPVRGLPGSAGGD